MNSLDKPQNPHHLEDNNKAMLYAVLLSIYWVSFLWGFWERGIYALGINASMFLVLIFVCLAKNRPQPLQMDKQTLSWVLPLFLIALSYSLYENPFIKLVNIAVIPLCFSLFYLNSVLRKEHKENWDFAYIRLCMGKGLNKPISLLGMSWNIYSNRLNQLLQIKAPHIKIVLRALKGTVLFLLLAFLLIIPLLSSADPAFEKAVSSIYSKLGDLFLRLIELDSFLRSLTAGFLALFFLGILFGWNQVEKPEQTAVQANLDPIVSGIILGGTILLYALFIALQIDRMWINSLPLDFKTTETLVKSGFWQLIVLSSINLLLFFTYFKKTIKPIQYLLLVFTISSLLILCSAGHRMYLYVSLYGFSYEKFYASYAVLYCSIIFILLLFALTQKNSFDALKASLYLFLWMYALVCIFPVEQFVLRSNLILSQREQSRIQIDELKMLSTDVLGLVKSGQWCHMQTLRKDKICKNHFRNWHNWIQKRHKEAQEKTWWEQNLMSFIAAVPSNTHTSLPKPLRE